MKMAEKLATDSFTLEDFLDQMQQLKKMGSMKKMLGMLPGMGQMKQQLEDFDEREIDRTEAIIRSMTPVERRNPKVLNGSRRLRIARGSGMTVTDVNGLVNRFEQAAKMMKTVARGGTPNIPGMGPIPGSPPGRVGQARQAAAKAQGSRSGNPAKRAAENAGIAASAPAAPTGSGFGLGAAQGPALRAHRARPTSPSCRSCSARAEPRHPRVTAAPRSSAGDRAGCRTISAADPPTSARILPVRDAADAPTPPQRADPGLAGPQRRLRCTGSPRAGRAPRRSWHGSKATLLVEWLARARRDRAHEREARAAGFSRPGHARRAVETGRPTRVRRVVADQSRGAPPRLVARRAAAGGRLTLPV